MTDLIFDHFRNHNTAQVRDYPMISKILSRSTLKKSFRSFVYRNFGPTKFWVRVHNIIIEKCHYYINLCNLRDFEKFLDLHKFFVNNSGACQQLRAVSTYRYDRKNRIFD